MEEIAYSATIIAPSFGTIIRRISAAGNGDFTKPRYNIILGWNAAESLMILYKQEKGHQLLNISVGSF